MGRRWDRRPPQTRQRAENQRPIDALCLYQQVVADYFLKPNRETLRQLAEVVQHHHAQLPAEQVANETVDKVFLNVIHEHLWLWSTIRILLENTDYASATLADVVDAIDEDGREQARVNPLRLRLFAKLEQHLVAGHNVYQTLAVALNTAHRLDPSAHRAGTDVRVATIEAMLVRDVTPHSPRIHQALEVLQGFQTGHREAASSLALCLLGRPPRSHPMRPCRTCRQTTQHSHFLTVLHNSEDPSLVRLVSDCATRLLDSLPASFWRSRDTARTSSSLTQRWQEGLADLAGIVDCRTRRLQPSWSESLAALSAGIVTSIPWEQIDAHGKLWSHTYQLLQAWTRQVRSNQFSKAAQRVLTQACGGHDTPSGQVTPICAVWRSWLSKNGTALCMDLLPSNHSALLRSILRVYPEVLLYHAEAWSRLKTQLAAADKPSDSHLLETLEGLLIGRREHEERLKDEPSLFEIRCLWPFLASSISVGSVACKRSAAACYAQLLSQDWQQQDATNAIGHVRLVLDLCTDSSLAAKVRAAGCKSLGDVCATFFTIARVDDDPFQTLCRDMSMCLNQLLLDPNPAVQGMALFAIGNFAQVLRGQCPDLIAVDDLKLLAQGVYGLMKQDADEKVTSNAIRSVGHVTSLLLLRQGSQESCFRFVQSVLQALQQLVNMSRLLLDPQQRATRTWKQRQAARKHGWGACNTLALLWKDGVADCNEYQGECQRCVQALIECLGSKGLNSKVVICASAALRSIEPMTLARLATGDLGSGLVSCVGLVLDPESVQGKLRTELEALLLHLLQCASTAQLLLLVESISSRQIEAFVHWMVERNCPAAMFGTVALALERSNIDNVPVEILVSSKATSYSDDTEEL